MCIRDSAHGELAKGQAAEAPGDGAERQRRPAAVVAGKQPDRGQPRPPVGQVGRAGQDELWLSLIHI